MTISFVFIFYFPGNFNRNVVKIIYILFSLNEDNFNLEIHLSQNFKVPNYKHSGGEWYKKVWDQSGYST